MILATLVTGAIAAALAIFTSADSGVISSIFVFLNTALLLRTGQHARKAKNVSEQTLLEDRVGRHRLRRLLEHALNGPGKDGLDHLR